ncbi:lipid A biosynthesis acyltransferase [Segetibacter sp. 3557_3]|uniref:lysophospholipid acyltransferase family protein n=1 Tax=Segetibacter sp. 3557_3 TaxID=2547429 RepID=UPI0010585B91|nr:lipid A biosynthesis acyltransferase [Segetibacter sp. 3557_3]TDH26242.1 lipid A biosynthesis acyltransferase [Segetibacter sp. 3557_3]
MLYYFLYLLSLLPWRVLYFFSDGLYGFIYYVLGYRRKVVMSNLAIAFPEKTERERTRIAKDFYHNFIDTFFEIIKFLSLSDKDFSNRVSGNFDLLDRIYETGQNVQLHSGHFFNIEYFNWAIPKYTRFPFLGVYMPVSNKAVNKIIFEMRRKYNTIMISAGEFKTTFHTYAKGRYALGLAADQTPGSPDGGLWLHFFGKLTPFVAGPEKSARINNTAVVWVHYYKVKRGYYHADFSLLTTEPQQYGRGELTKEFVRKLEESIRKKPANYLWSHRRWKHPFKEAYRKLVID